MNEEASKYHLLVRLAAYSGCSLRFGLVGFVDGVPFISAMTALHHLPPGKTLLETAQDMMEMLAQQVPQMHMAYDLPDNIQWVEVVSPGVCLN